VDLKAKSGRAAALRRAKTIGPLSYHAGRIVRHVQRKCWNVSKVCSGLGTWLESYEGRKAAEFWQWWDGQLSNRERPVNWRKVIPVADDYEAIFAELLDKLRPDVLHAHDMHVIGVASRAAGRAALRGRDVKVVYDAHEYVAGLSTYSSRTPRLIAACAQHEREYIRTVDHVVTVSPAIARTLLKR
jgi:hypothetical protein